MTFFRRAARISQVLGTLTFIVVAPAASQRVEFNSDPRGGTFEVDWAGDQEKARFNISSDVGVSVRVSHFNFLRYDAGVSASVDTVAALVSLSTLTDQIGELAGRIVLLGAGAESAALREALDAWQAELKRTAESVRSVTTSVDSVAVSDSTLARVTNTYVNLDLDGAPARLAALRANAVQHVGGAGDQFRFGIVDAQHKEVSTALGETRKRYRWTRDGKAFNLPKPVPGTIVEVSVSATRENSTVMSATFGYVVASKPGIRFHVGASFAAADDADYEAVSTTLGTDYFVRVRDDDVQEDMVAFATYVLWQDRGGRLGIGPSIGVSVSDPGSDLFAGLSVKVGPLYITFGGASVETAEAGSSVLEDLGGALGTRELFESFSLERKWNGFVSFSLRLAGG